MSFYTSNFVMYCSCNNDILPEFNQCNSIQGWPKNNLLLIKIDAKAIIDIYFFSLNS